ncbi:MAG: GNAT family acetyltransferase [Actinomycetales bacterium]|nr:GNAT family acetyltransferase [Actinomycetales bacterium]
MTLAIRPFAEGDTEEVVALWEACGLTRPWNDPRRDIARKLVVQRELFLVGETRDPEVGTRLVATGMGGYEGHRAWINYLGVHPDARGRGVGRAIAAELERRLAAVAAPKINLQVRQGNDEALAFWAALGYSVDAAVSLGKRLVED